MFGLFMTTAVGIGGGPALLAAASGLTTIYIICLIAGGGLLVISILFGSHSDVSVDHPLDADLGLDVDAHVGLDADVAVDADLATDVGGDLHAGHAGAQDGRGHFEVLIVSEAFGDAGRLQRHRMVFDALGELMDTDIHALRVRALTPSER